MSSSLTGYRGPAGGNLRGNSAGQNLIPKGFSAGQLSNFTPQQNQLFKSLFSNVGQGSYLSRLSQGDEDLFNEIEAPQMRQYDQFLSQAANRFSNQGMGARRSSGFKNFVNQGASDFAQDLGAKRQGLQRQALMDLMGISESLLGQRPYDRFLTQKQPKGRSFLQELLGNFAGGAGNALFGQLGGL